MRAPLEEALQPVDLDEDEGIGEPTAFLYDENLGVLALEKNRRGATPTKFARYFNRFIKHKLPVELLPIFSQDALETFRRMERHTKMRIKIASGDQDEINTNNESLKNILKVADQMSSPYLDLTLSVGQLYRDHELNGNSVSTLVHDLYNDFIGENDSAEIEKIIINGRTSEQKTEVVDLIEDRMRDSISLSTDENRALPYDLRSVALRGLYQDRQSELAEMIGGNQS